MTLLTNFSANEDFFAVFWSRLTNVLVDARANIKQQTSTVRPFQEISSINFGQIFFTSSLAKRQRPATEEETYLEFKLRKFRGIVKTLCTYFQFNL